MTTLPPLRIALEPGYDGGRVGAWLLDLPGAFGWAANAEAAVSQAGSVAGWWRDWLGRHGEPWPIGDFEWPVVAEEVAVTMNGGHDINATFEIDRRPVASDDLERALQRLELARADLLALLDRLAIVRAADGERTADEVVRHLASVEIWLGSRIDPGARYGGDLDEPDARRHLASTRAWAAENLRRLLATDPSMHRIDSMGEEWTLAKVVRRFVYHAIDHLRELDRRLAVAENRESRLRWSGERVTDPAPLARVLRSVGWDRRAIDLDRLRAALDNSRATVAAWDGEEMVGFARELGDGVFNASIAMVIVDPRWQGLGIASRLVGSIVEGRPGVRFTLAAAPGVEGLYERFGFERDPRAMVRRRLREPGDGAGAKARPEASIRTERLF